MARSAPPDPDDQMRDRLQTFTPQKMELMPNLIKRVRTVFQSHQMRCSVQDARDIAGALNALGEHKTLWHRKVDVGEIFTPPRFTSWCSQFGLKPGLCVDLCTKRPDGYHWDLSRAEDQVWLEQIISSQRPFLLTGSPPCAQFSRINQLNRGRVSKEVWEWRQAQGRRLLHVAIKSYWQQLHAGRYFLHEHPAFASSWNDPKMQQLVAQPGVFLVQGPMCRWGMRVKSKKDPFEGYARKETKWLTNSPFLAKILQGTCSASRDPTDPKYDWHRHLQLIGGTLCRQAQVYPAKLVKAALRGILKQMEHDGCHNKVY